MINPQVEYVWHKTFGQNVTILSHQSKQLLVWASTGSWTQDHFLPESKTLNHYATLLPRLNPFLLTNTSVVVLESGLCLESSNSWSWSRTRMCRDSGLGLGHWGLGLRPGQVLSRRLDYLFTVKFLENPRTAIMCTSILLL